MSRHTNTIQYYLLVLLLLLLFIWINLARRWDLALFAQSSLIYLQIHFRWSIFLYYRTIFPPFVLRYVKYALRCDCWCEMMFCRKTQSTSSFAIACLYRTSFFLPLLLFTRRIFVVVVMLLVSAIYLSCISRVCEFFTLIGFGALFVHSRPSSSILFFFREIGLIVALNHSVAIFVSFNLLFVMCHFMVLELIHCKQDARDK